MRSIFFVAVIFLQLAAFAQDKDQKLIIITTDGLRWQEVFTGMDAAIANDKRFNQQDSLYIYKKYWAQSPEGRRQKLMPFFWGTIAKQGQLYGNRNHGNKVNNANPYWFSYPGYSEIMTGYVDTLINSNEYPPNPHTNILEYFNRQPNYKGRVAAFGAWEAFDRILNEKRAGFPVINAYDDISAAAPDAQMQLINDMLQSAFKPFGKSESLDVFNHYQAISYLKAKKPKALFISYGDTDEFAHHSEYKYYLDAAHQFDAWIGEIWKWVQSQPDYKDKTTLLITTDHGRGDLTKSQWTSHGQSIPDASQIWFSVIGPRVKALGEIKVAQQWYQKQLAQTAASLVGHTFTAEHEIGEAIPVPKK